MDAEIADPIISKRGEADPESLQGLTAGDVTTAESIPAEDEAANLGADDAPAFRVNTDEIESIALENQAEELRSLGLQVYDQTTFEEGILKQVDDALSKQEKLRAILNSKKTVKKTKLKEVTDGNGTKREAETSNSNSSNEVVDPNEVLNAPVESEQERLIRLGHMTPFGTVVGKKAKPASELTSFEKYLLEQDKLQKQRGKPSIKGNSKSSPAKGKSIAAPKAASTHKSPLKQNILFPKKKKKLNKDLGTEVGEAVRYRSRPITTLAETAVIDFNGEEEASGSEYLPSSDEETFRPAKKPKRKSGRKRKAVDDKDWPDDNVSESEGSGFEESQATKCRKDKVIDDGDMKMYRQRLHECTEIPSTDDHEEFEGGYRVPLSIWNRLYKYQQVGVRWLWELHAQRCGGILGDEMGLGKTIQIISFLAGLSYSKLLGRGSNYRGLGPVLLVAPATVMHQWVKEFHTWWPFFRVAILHESGSHTGSRDSLILSMNKTNGVLITSYSGLSLFQDMLLKLDWHYIILDEGHKIRNPDAQVTVAAKQFRTSHRLILSGSPMQNNLKELWSLFDFVFPGKLGTLPVFLQQFAVPITQGGYSNATQVQVATAYRCATVLRDTISPYLLRRMKADVKDHLKLPGKNEQVLFCSLTEEQRDLYKRYLDSGDIKSIIDGRLQIFVGLTILRKICNHPDLFSGGPKSLNNGDVRPEDKFGYVKKSGKMIVVESLLKIWKQQGHKVLLFSQSRQMLCILEAFVQDQNYTYLRLDGTTTISSRQTLIHQFNTDPNLFVFLLTTRVGGLGVNLTGANRVVIYDPDWNPSTDTQARERAWRIGQARDVTVYRLLTSGTIEEKIYHRQIFKQYLTNRVLKDPKQRRFFKSNDLYELFTLKETQNDCTETEAIFAGTGAEVAGNYGASPAAEGQSKRSKNDELLQKWNKERERRQQLWQKELERKKRKEEKKNESKEERKKRKMEEKKRKEEMKKVQVDGNEVEFVVKKSVFQPSNHNQEGHPEESGDTANQDDYVLKKLFAKTGVLSALKHDSIIDAGDPDYALVEGEAERVAKQAVLELKNSRRMCWSAEEGVPTWTGQSGALRSSDSQPKPRFGAKKKAITVTKQAEAPEAGPSSSAGSEEASSESLLQRMRSRNRLLGLPLEIQANDDSDSDSGFTGVSREEERILGADPVPMEFTKDVDYRDILNQIRTFIAFGGERPGQVHTSEILEEFRDKLPQGSAALFRALLKELCHFSRDLDKRGVWQLKSDFR